MSVKLHSVCVNLHTMCEIAQCAQNYTYSIGKKSSQLKMSHWRRGQRGRLISTVPKGPASCKQPSRGAGLLQMIIRRGQPLANEHQEGPALLQVIIRHPCRPSHLCQDPDSIPQTFLDPIVLVDLCEVGNGHNYWWVFCYQKELVGSFFLLFCTIHTVCCTEKRLCCRHLLWRLPPCLI